MITANANGVLRNLGEVTANDGGILKKLSTVHANDGGVLRKVFESGKSVSNLNVSDIVKMNINGTAHEFIIVHIGRPSSMYDSSCDGVWVLIKNCYIKNTWASNNFNAYKNSTINSYLNNTFYNLFEENSKKLIKTVKIPYSPARSSSDGRVSSGADGLSCNIFLLSGYEVGWVNNGGFLADGACLSYFAGTAQTDRKRIALYNGSYTEWWLRTPAPSSNMDGVYYVTTTGYNSFYHDCASVLGVRPALVLDYSAKVDNNGFIVA